MRDECVGWGRFGREKEEEKPAPTWRSQQSARMPAAAGKSQKPATIAGIPIAVLRYNEQ